MTTLQVTRLGVVVEIRKTGEDTGGELIEFDVIGRARGLIAQPHVHTQQTETPRGDRGLDAAHHRRPRAPAAARATAMTVPAGTPHRQLPGPEPGPGRVRVQLRPAGDGEAFLHRLAEMDVQPLRLPGAGRPRPSWCATSAPTGHAAKPSLRVQRKLLRGDPQRSRRASTCSSTSGTSPRRARRCSTRSPTPAATREWWKPVYIDVEADGEPALGKESRQHFKGRLPYHLHTRSRIVRARARRTSIEGDVDGDLRGHGAWTLTETAGGGTHVRFDWQVYADQPLLRAADAGAAPGVPLEPRVGDRAARWRAWSRMRRLGRRRLSRRPWLDRRTSTAGWVGGGFEPRFLRPRAPDQRRGRRNSRSGAISALLTSESSSRSQLVARRARPNPIPTQPPLTFPA